MKPLRESDVAAREETGRLLEEDTFIWVLAPVFALFCALMEWTQWLFGSPPYQFMFTGMGLLVFAYSIYRLRRTRRQLRALRAAREAERDVVHAFGQLPESGRILHDLTGDTFTVSHAVVCPQGVFVVEPALDTGDRPGSEEGLAAVLDNPAMRTCIEQAAAGAAWARDRLERDTGRPVRVQPVVVLSGRAVTPVTNAAGLGVWVLNPRDLASCIRREPVALAHFDLVQATFCLSRHIAP